MGDMVNDFIEHGIEMLLCSPISNCCSQIDLFYLFLMVYSTSCVYGMKFPTN